MVEAALKRVTRRGAIRWTTPLAAALLIALLLALMATGRWPELRSKVSFSSSGLLTIAPSEIDRVEVRSGSDSLAFHRRPGGCQSMACRGPRRPRSHRISTPRFGS